MNTLDLQTLNTASSSAFVQALGAIFEHSPWVAERVAGQRPFASVQDLHTAMVQAIEDEGLEAQLRLIRAHPELAGKAAVRGDLTEESTREQSGAGLHLCSAEEFAKLHALNDAYNRKFGFPFIVAVRGHTRHSIIALFEQRLAHGLDDERHECLRQIYKIGALRLHDLLGAG